MDQQKLCKKCNAQKRHVTVSGKQITYCRACNNELKRKSYRRHPETSKLWHHKDYQNNRPHYQNRMKKWALDNKEKIREYGKTIHARFAHAKASAKKRNIPFLLSKEEYANIYLNKCYYCSNLFEQQVKWASGLDRLDSNKPYVMGNVVSCCMQCNSLKGKYFSENETKAMVDLVLRMRKLR